MAGNIRMLLVVVCCVILFTAQSRRDDDGDRLKRSERTGPSAPGNRQVPDVHDDQPGSRFGSERAHHDDNGSSPQARRGARPAPQARKVMRVYHDPDEKRPMRRPHRKYWHPRYNFYERGYHFYPYVNLTSIVEIPPEAVQFLFEGNVYYYDQWAFYQQTAEGYVAVPPPIGAIVPAISANAAQSIINGEVYYRYNDVYYKPVPQGYEVVEPQQ